MENHSPPRAEPPSADALASKLQDKLRRERPRWQRWAPVIAVVLLGMLGLFAWLIYPAPAPPRLTITALDALVLAGEPAAVRAFLEPQDPEASFDAFAGLEVGFWTANDADGAARQTATANSHGEARAALAAADPKGATFTARFVSQQKYQVHDIAAIYALPREAALLLVDVEETLAELDPAEWGKTNPIGVALRAGAAAALKSAADKGSHVVYFAVHGVRPKDYRPVRGWVENKSVGLEPLPRGPVLSRLEFAAPGKESATSAHDARQALLSRLRSQFTGPLAAVVRTSAAAEQCLKLEIRPLATGGGDFPEGVIRLKSWADLPAALGK